MNARPVYAPPRRRLPARHVAMLVIGAAQVMLGGAVLGWVACDASSPDYPAYIECGNYVVTEDDGCVVVPLWAVGG